MFVDALVLRLFEAMALWSTTFRHVRLLGRVGRCPQAWPNARVGKISRVIRRWLRAQATRGRLWHCMPAAVHLGAGIAFLMIFQGYVLLHLKM